MRGHSGEFHRANADSVSLDATYESRSDSRFDVDVVENRKLIREMHGERSNARISALENGGIYYSLQSVVCFELLEQNPIEEKCNSLLKILCFY